MATSRTNFASWIPDRAHSVSRPPESGALVAFEHAVWRVVEVRPVPEDMWTDHDRTMLRNLRPAHWATAESAVVVLRPVSNISGATACEEDRHLRHRWGRSWYVYPDEHFPLCSQCGEPTPCREVLAERATERLVERELARMARFENPGVCPACGEPVTGRQKSLTFAENVEIPGGPPVTFHVGRSACFNWAAGYEVCWAAADPSRRTTLTPDERGRTKQ